MIIFKVPTADLYLLWYVYSLVPFLRGIVEQDYDLVRPFVPYLLRLVLVS